MAQLAIKGHATRGEEVIQLLEMLGGVNVFDLEGAETQGFYYISKDNNKIYYCWNTNAENVIVFTLEEFEKKFPYKIGDDVLAYAEGCLAKFTIQDIRWNYELNKVEYKICSSWYDTSLIQPYKEKKTIEEKENSIVVNIEHKQLKVHSLRFDKTQLVINDEYELKQEGNAYYIVRKEIQYPKTYKECVKIFCCSNAVYIDGYKTELLEVFQQLLICRDAYWKIAGEEMGLDKPWKPDWSTESEVKYVIEVYRNNVRTNSQGYSNTILAFPTPEMRNAFFDNFKDLIEQCKELL